jgi:hypothetical protein
MKSLISLAFISLFGVGVALAQNPHINKKDQSSVIATCSIEEVCFTGVVAGNGNASSVNAYLIVEVDASTLCYNPAGGAKEADGVPGHKNVIIQGPSQTFDCRNGKAFLQNVCTSLDIAVDCPNDQWTGVVEDLSILSVTLVINGKTLDVSSYYSGCIHLSE